MREQIGFTGLLDIMAESNKIGAKLIQFEARIEYTAINVVGVLACML